jgi:hypothetical protein
MLAVEVVQKISALINEEAWCDVIWCDVMLCDVIDVADDSHHRLYYTVKLSFSQPLTYPILFLLYALPPPLLSSALLCPLLLPALLWPPESLYHQIMQSFVLLELELATWNQ